MTFSLKYRPSTFDDLIGHETHLTRLKGLKSNLEKGETKNALLITGPTSVGKTTLARCFAAEVNGLKNAEGHPDYIEYNAAEGRTMEDVKQWVKSARYMPQTKRRFIVVDEAQGLLGNGAAAAAFLKPLEEPGNKTIWILCSMDPAKFASDKNGKAIANRCTQFNLEPHTNKELLKFAKRIAKAEGMKYVLDDDLVALKAVVMASQGAMRNVANLVETLKEYYEGMEKKPKLLDPTVVSTVLQSTESKDDDTAAKLLKWLYKGDFRKVQRNLLDVQDGYQFINKLLWANTYLMNQAVLNGERHSKVWPSQAARLLIEACKAEEVKPNFSLLASTNECLVGVKCQMQSFATSAEELLSARLYRLIQESKG